MALLLVLTALAFSLALLVALLSMGRRQIAASSSSARMEELRLLARLPSLRAMHALDRLRTETAAPDGSPRLWTSQPGLIRLWPASSEDTRRVIRLYSHHLPEHTPFDEKSEGQSLRDWRQRPAAFTDLNQPRWSREGPVFPIADPRAVGEVEGFAIDESPASDHAHPLPMPVAWIYVLRDGREIIPQPGAHTKALFDSEWLSADNPIVGRYAFWTDDESCKLNLNTASEPVFSGPSHARTLEDEELRAHRPAAGEFHRLPGHPAFTALSPVLGSLLEQDTDAWTKTRSLLQISPNGPTPDSLGLGSQGGSVPAAGRVIPRQNEPYPLIGDALLDPQRKLWPHAEFPVPITRSALQRRAFFLTTRNAAPELTPWGTPKISLWPVFAEDSLRDDTDREIAAASTLANQAFHFQRPKAWSRNHVQELARMTDFWSVARNCELLDDLTRLTNRTVPGFEGSLADTHGPANRDQLLLSMIDMLNWAVNPVSAGEHHALPPPGERGAASALPLLGPEAMTADESAKRRGFGRLPTVTEVAVVIAFTDVARDAEGRPLDANGDGFCDRATKLRAFMLVEPFLVSPGDPAPAPSFCYRFRRLMHWRIGRQNLNLHLPGGSVLNRCSFDPSAPYPPGSNHPAWDDTGGGYSGLAPQFLQTDGAPKRIGRRDDPNRFFPFISEQDVVLAPDEGKPGGRLPLNCGFITLDILPENALQQSPREHDSIQSLDLSFTPQDLIVPPLRVTDFEDGPRDLSQRFIPVPSTELGRAGQPVTVWRLPLIQEGDLVRSVELNPDGPSRGDARLIAARRWVPLVEVNGTTGASHRYFRDHPAAVNDPAVAESHSLRESRFQWSGRHYHREEPPDRLPAPPALDHLCGGADFEDGAFILRLHQGDAFDAARRALHDCPLAQVSSAFLFGGLPTGLFGSAKDTTPRPWQSLRLHPFDAPVSPLPAPDHLWLELFWMPVTQPRLLSRDLATEGKVNLNHRLIPFPWIQRRSALHGALRGVQLTAIPREALDDSGDHAKRGRAGKPLAASFRYEIDADKTLHAVESKLERDGAFRTPSEICAILLASRRVPGRLYEGGSWLVTDPASVPMQKLGGWCPTADNLREEPYAALYPRLCTRSNVFRVHYRVQLLQQPRDADPAQWDEMNGRIEAEQRGSVLIERHLRVDATQLADPATGGTPLNLERHYHLRVLHAEPF